MERNWKELRKKRHQFKSYYCAGCRQRKPCGVLTGWDSEWKSYCCPCYYQTQEERAKEYFDYQQVYQQKEQERQKRIQQYRLLREYSGCKQCGSKEVDAYSLYEDNRLVCQPCRMRKESSASSPISFLEQGKWYKKRWGINLAEWLDNYQCLPVNAGCADRWLKDKEHLPNQCACLEKEARETYSLFANSLREMEKKLSECACEMSEKVRVGSDYYAWCESCDKTIEVASKKRVVKNRNDPNFWGLNIKERVLCGFCLTNWVEKMPVSKKYTFNKYEKRGYWK